MRYYIVIDLEMCNVRGVAKKKIHGLKNEIIQIGAVMLDEKNQVVDKFSRFVKPEYGYIDDFIEKLTGIKQENVEKAQVLRAVLMQFADWIGDKEVKVMSWSDSDYEQLRNEMRIKKIKHHKIQKLFEEWIDFQRSFDVMLGLPRQYALEEALKLGKVQTLGRQHNGLCDAYNTASLFAKIQKQKVFTLELLPIAEYENKTEHLSYSISELFTAELLAQIDKTESPEDIYKRQKCNGRMDKKWTVWRKIYRIFKGKEAVSEENWNKYLFMQEMKHLDRQEFVCKLIKRKDVTTFSKDCTSVQRNDLAKLFGIENIA